MMNYNGAMAFNGRRLYTGLRLDYRLRLLAPTSASRAISAVAEFLVLYVVMQIHFSMPTIKVTASQSKSYERITTLCAFADGLFSTERQSCVFPFSS